ncbi:MAG: translation initiation factor IF-2 [Thaumarchaeota archaeon]|nr:translation initiation factor IF-2 [Nitrososphaerota archaeon]
MPETKTRLRQPVVVVLGHVDSGKCISGDSIIQVADGRMMEAEKLFEELRSGEPVEVPDGVAYPARGVGLLSVTPEGKVVERNVSHVWKLHSDTLVTVHTRAGYSVKCTPEHKFLAMNGTGNLEYVEAGKLRLGDHLALPAKTEVQQPNLERVKSEILRRISDDFLVRVSSSFNQKVAKFSSGRKSALGNDLGDGQFRNHVKAGYYRARVFMKLAAALGIPLSAAYDSIDGLKRASPKMRAGHTSPWIRIPKTEAGFEALAYLVGLLYGDGVAESAYLSNTSDDIINAFSESVFRSFGVQTAKAWRRTSYIVSHKGGMSLARFLNEVFDYPISDKTRSLHVPEVITMMPDKMVASFLRGFFDAEGFVQEGKNIGVGCESKLLMKQLPILLQRFGCLAYFGRSHSREIFISGKESVSAFVEHVGFRSREKMTKATGRLSASETNRIFDLTPIPGEFLRTVRKSNSVVWDRHFQLTSFEPYARLSRGVLKRLSTAVPGYDNKLLEQIVTNYAMVQVSGLEVSQGDFTVYDFSIDDLHNFLANGLIVHNTTLLDALRGTAVQAHEVGGITQEIGASFFPLATLEQICGPLLNRAGGELEIPGLLMIDTPGHAVFSNLRLRGGSAADIAIVVVDVLKGLENQTLESIDILKQRKVPFLVALNTVDMIVGWRKGNKGQLLQVLKEQPPEWNDELEERLYNVVGGLSRLGFQSDAYYRVKDFKQQATIVPISARNKLGIPELLAVLIGLSQQFLKGKLQMSESKGGRGIILEMQEEVGIGETANVILTEGRFKVGDSIALVRRDGAFKSKVKALFMPKPLDEMRDPRDKFTTVDSVYAAAGVKLVSADLAGVVAGTSVASFKNDAQFQSLKGELEKELLNVVVKTDNMGVIVKAGSVGGLEAVLRMLEERGVPVRQADIGEISRNDIVDAQVVGDHDPYLGAILGFDSKVLPEAKDFVGTVPIFVSGIIYEVIDNYVNWSASKKEADERVALSNLTRPCKLKALPGAFFRRNDPAVFGVEILVGRLKPKVKLMSPEGQDLGTVKQIQDSGKSILEAKKGEKVAISVDGPTLGRQVKENDTIYTLPRSHEVRLLRTKLLGSLTEDEHQVLEEIMRIKSAADPMFGF